MLRNLAEVLYCCDLSQSLTSELGKIPNYEDISSITVPVVLQTTIGYNQLIVFLKEFMIGLSNSSAQIIDEDLFIAKYDILTYGEEDLSDQKLVVISNIIKLVQDMETCYSLSGLLNIDQSIMKRDRALIGFMNNNPEGESEYLKYLSLKSDDDDSDSDMSYESDEDPDEIIFPRDRTFLGDRDVDFKELRILGRFSEEYYINKDSGISNVDGCQLMTNVTTSNFASLYLSFIQTGSIRPSLVKDFQTLVTLYTQDFALEVSPGRLKSKSNYRNPSAGRSDLKSIVTKNQINLKVNGESYWKVIRWLDAKNTDQTNCRLWCEELLLKLILYLDLINKLPDDLAPFPPVVSDQNFVFSTLTTDITYRDIRLAALSIDFDLVFTSNQHIRSQLRTLVSYILILTSNSYVRKVDENGYNKLEWTLFPLTINPVTGYLTNINYRDLYILLKILIELSI